MSCSMAKKIKNKERKKYNGLNHVKSNRGMARSVLSDVFCHVPHVHDSSMCMCQVPMHWNPSNPQGYKGLSASTFDFWFVFLPFELQSLIPAIVDDGHSFAIHLQGPLTTSYWKVCPNGLFTPTKDIQKQVWLRYWHSGFFFFFKKSNFTAFCTILSTLFIKVSLLINKTNLF